MSFFGKGSKLYSIFKGKCPECHEGDFFVSTPYDLKHIGDIKDHCDKCGLKYEKEPGFYYGAMYVAYALGVATFVTLWVSMNLFFNNVSVSLQIGIVITTIILLSPYLYTLSKIIWANMFLSFKDDSQAIKDHGSKERS
jgi:uncharacterized protein (DUF983 family)